VDKHLQHTNPYIRKKAALTTIRLLRKVPDLVDTFLPRIVVLLTDKNHNVLLGGVCLVAAVLELVPALAPKFTRLVPALVKILRRLMTAEPKPPEYEVGGVTDPFLQCRILSLLRALGKDMKSETVKLA
jgi:AP-1 complex subunit gamma-1